MGEVLRLVEISFVNESAAGSVVLDGEVSVSDLLGNDMAVGVVPGTQASRLPKRQFLRRGGR